MKNCIFSFLLLFLISLFNCTQKTTESLINGKIIHPTDKIIRIGDNSVSVSENGEFSFIPKPYSPPFYEISYADVHGVIYTEPGKITGFTLSPGNLSGIEFTGDLKSCNDFLKEIFTKNSGTNNFLNDNWVSIHNRDESGFISVMDSLKGLFLNPLSSLSQKDKDISRNFIKLFTAEVNFGYNQLIMFYPERHLIYTGEHVIFSKIAEDYVNTINIDDRALFGLSNYNSFCHSWIDYQADLVANKDTAYRHYNFKKMDAVFQIIPDMFHDQYLSDYWHSEYLSGFISRNGLTNSVNYIKNFNSFCKTKEFNDRINEIVKTERKKREDHLVKEYKTIEGLVLEAHIFFPDNLAKNEKRPAIVLFHGGGWQVGDPSWMFGNALHFKRLGLVAIAAQYRLANLKDITVFESLTDARDVIKWIRSNSDSLHVISDSIAAYGWSAGGHLAISAAIFHDSLTVNGIDSSPNATVLFSPAVSLPTNMSWIISALGYGSDRSSINPVDHVRKGLPPTIILQGRDDTVTPLAGAQLFTDKMHASGNICELIIFDNVGHLFTPNTMPDYNDPHPDPEILKKASEKADEFLVKLKYIKK